MNKSSFKVIDLLIRITVVGFIMAWCFMLVRPFIILLLWATILAVAFFPLFEWLKRLLGGRKKLAGALIGLLGIVFILGPVGFMGKTLVENVNSLVESVFSGTLVLPPPPEIIQRLPVFGESLDNIWQLASVNILDALVKLEPQIKQVASYLIPITADISFALFEFLLSIFISIFLMINARILNLKLTNFLKRLTPDKAEEFIDLASSTLRNIIRGIIGIAIVQTVIAGIGFVAIGMPSAGLLTLACLVLSIIQIGPTLVIIPSIIFIWFHIDNTLIAIVFTIWMMSATLIDNFLKPILMARGLSIPMIVIFLGVFGGTILHGIIGLFIGPVVLALGYDLLNLWINDLQTVKESKQTTPIN